MNHLCCGAKFKGSQCESILGKSCSQAFSVTFAKLQYPSTNPWLTRPRVLLEGALKMRALGKLILWEPYRTLIQFTRCQPGACVGAGMAKMNKSNKSA